MRRSGWALPAVALAAWVAAVAYPALALIPTLATAPPAEVSARNAASLFMTSFVWALAVAVAAVAVGWVPGRLLGRSVAQRRFLPLSALMLTPICVPAYVVFYAWWQAWPAESGLYRWAVEHDAIRLVKGVTLFLGLVCWSWPIAAWCVAGFAGAEPRHRVELLQLDDAGPGRRFMEMTRNDWRGLALGGVVVFLFVFNNTTSFDIAQFFTFGYELRALEAELDAGARAIMKAALPAILMAAAGVAAIYALLGRGHTEVAIRPAAPTRRALVGTIVIWLLSAALPAVLFVVNLTGAVSVKTFMQLYGRDLANTLGIALITGLASALIAVGLAAAWQDHRRWVRIAADTQAIGWLLAAVVPASTVGVALEAAYNRPGLDAVYTSPTVLVLGYLARFGFIAALLARWVSLREPREMRDLRRIDGADTLAGYIRATWPRLVAAAGASAAIAAVLSMSELVVASRVAPPGTPLIATAVLNAVHYQRPDTVLLAVLALIAFGLAAGAAAIVVFAPLRRDTL